LPNWTYNLLAVSGSTDDLRKFKHAVRAAEPDPESGERAVLDFDRLVPMPQELAEDRGDLEAGVFPAWHAWRLEHWGTKWNVWFPRLTGTLKSGELRYRFETAWTPPYEWLERVAPMFPALAFHLEYQEEMDHFSGVARWEAGQLVLDRALGGM
jgi:hypothetical protein